MTTIKPFILVNPNKHFEFKKLKKKLKRIDYNLGIISIPTVKLVLLPQYIGTSSLMVSSKTLGG